jgi:transcriptional regulator with XRE-family HTH domain
MAGRTRAELRIQRHQLDVHGAISRAVIAARLDIGATQAAFAAAAGISPAYLCEIEAGRALPSVDVLAALATAAGRRLLVGFAPDSDPIVRDRRQAPVVEALVRAAHPRWGRLLEVPVFRPVHGVIDVVLHDRPPTNIVCVEVESRLQRVEATIRWGEQKAHALLMSGPISVDPNGPRPTVSRVLALPSTRANREVVRTFEHSIKTAFPADPADLYAALITPDAPWPGSGILWFRVEGTSAHVLPGRPRSLFARGE